MKRGAIITGRSTCSMCQSFNLTYHEGTTCRHGYIALWYVHIPRIDHGINTSAHTNVPHSSARTLTSFVHPPRKRAVKWTSTSVDRWRAEKLQSGQRRPRKVQWRQLTVDSQHWYNIKVVFLNYFSEQSTRNDSFPNSIGAIHECSHMLVLDKTCK